MSNPKRNRNYMCIETLESKRPLAADVIQFDTIDQPDQIETGEFAKQNLDGMIDFESNAGTPETPPNFMNIQIEDHSTDDMADNLAMNGKRDPEESFQVEDKLAKPNKDGATEDKSSSGTNSTANGKKDDDDDDDFWDYDDADDSKHDQHEYLSSQIEITGTRFTADKKLSSPEDPNPDSNDHLEEVNWEDLDLNWNGPDVDPDVVDIVAESTSQQPLDQNLVFDPPQMETDHQHDKPSLDNMPVNNAGPDPSNPLED